MDEFPLREIRPCYQGVVTFFSELQMFVKPYAISFAVVACLCLSTTAHAERTVFLNGINLGNVELKNQSFTGAQVRFDHKGNIHITIPGFSVKKTEVPKKDGSRPSSPPPAKKPSLKGNYFLLATGPKTGKPPFAITVFINGKRVRKLTALGMFGEGMNRFLRPGANTVRIRAEPLGKRSARSSRERVEIVLGEGVQQKAGVHIRSRLLTYQRNGAEQGTFDHSYVIIVK